MEQKNTLKIWQMIMVTVIMVILLGTMFMPAYRITGKAVSDVFHSVSNLVGDWTGSKTLKNLINIYMDSNLSDEDCEKGLEDFEKSRGINPDNLKVITPFEIMTHSLPDLCVGKDANKAERNKFTSSFSDYSSVKKGYNKIRAGLIISYTLLLAFLIFLIVSFVAKLSKWPTLIANSIYSLIITFWFAYLEYGLMHSISDKISESLIDDLDEVLGLDLNAILDMVNVESVVENGISLAAASIISSFKSIAFIIAFLVAILLLIANVISMLIGKKEQILERSGYGNDSFVYDPSMDQESMNTYGFDSLKSKDNMVFGGDNTVGMGTDYFGNREDPEVIPVTIAKQDNIQLPPSGTHIINQTPPMPAQFSVMGVVQCIKGVSAGKGLQLPEDKKVIVGKNPQKTNLVINDPTVSNVHCSICYSGSANVYIVTDHSTNGTFVNGNRLKKGVPTTCKAGTVLSLSDGKNEIKLG